jgi:hypothetical protein
MLRIIRRIPRAPTHVIRPARNVRAAAASTRPAAKTSSVIVLGLLAHVRPIPATERAPAVILRSPSSHAVRAGTVQVQVTPARPLRREAILLTPVPLHGLVVPAVAYRPVPMAIVTVPGRVMLAGLRPIVHQIPSAHQGLVFPPGLVAAVLCIVPVSTVIRTVIGAMVQGVVRM